MASNRAFRSFNSAHLRDIAKRAHAPRLPMTANTALISGIYTITNTVSGVVYVGSAVNIKRRWGEHRKHLRAHKHKNAFLQAAWCKHGEAAFVHSVVRLCELDVLIAAEQAEMDRLVAKGGWSALYNLNPIAGSRLGTRLSDESRARIGAAQRGNTKHTGHKHSEETLAKMRARVTSEGTLSAAKTA